MTKFEPILNKTDGALRAPNRSGEAGRKRGVGKMNARLALAWIPQNFSGANFN